MSRMEIRSIARLLVSSDDLCLFVITLDINNMLIFAKYGLIKKVILFDDDDIVYEFLTSRSNKVYLDSDELE